MKIALPPNEEILITDESGNMLLAITRYSRENIARAHSLVASVSELPNDAWAEAAYRLSDILCLGREE